MIDPIELAALVGSGWMKKDIAAHFGVSRSAIHRNLVDLGLNDPPPQRQPKCARGHDMSDAFIKRDGSRECRGCKRMRDAEWQRKKYWEKKSKAEA